MLTFPCPHCQAILRTDLSLETMTSQCAKCHQDLTLFDAIATAIREGGAQITQSETQLPPQALPTHLLYSMRANQAFMHSEVKTLVRSIVEMGQQVSTLVAQQTVDRNVSLNEAATFDEFRKLGENVNVLLLGASHDRFHVPANLAEAIRIYGVDAVAPDMEPEGVRVQSAVAGNSGKAVFYERSYAHCSSLTRPLPGAVERYALQPLYRVVKEHEVDCVTVAELQLRQGVDRWDFLKTDLEGLDFAVVASLGDEIRRTAVLQMELRWEPFYVGEPYLHEVVAYLHQYGFRVIDISLHRWRNMTAQASKQAKGHAVISDVYLVNANADAPMRLRQAIVLACLGYANYAQRVLGEAAFSSETETRASREILELCQVGDGKEHFYSEEFPHMTQHLP